ncbi:hypothetical protein NP493_19g12019 [Ridgeia piscesae]|uniref:Protein kinase domain-containing protein n=1 Tax=Ridgeia piscesae TaxID=27915 RepID=A0AAD9PDS2_RIDPI|nr:hypothetical protein NP493_19g12019 [Ridgeia piscesae]
MGCDCFPGTCEIACDDYCACSSGFEGRYRHQNCLTMRDSPNFIKCQLSLKVTYGGFERTVFTGNCNQDNLYSSHQNVSSAIIEWVTQLDPLPDTPPTPTYMRTVKFGIVSTSGTGVIRDTGHTSIYQEIIRCSTFTSEQEPVQPLKCTYKHDLRSATIAHNYRLQVNLQAKGGGYKITKASSNRMYFKGKTGSRAVTITFDLTAPTHCKLKNNCIKPNYLPVDVGRQIDKNASPNRYVGWAGWLDNDSGLQTFSYKVYELTPDSSGTLTKTPTPLFEGQQSAFKRSLPTYKLHKAGMYAVVLRVDDLAGNSAYGRGLFLWDPVSSVKVNRKKPMSVSGVTAVSDTGGDYVWLTSSVAITVKWLGHFENELHHNKGLLNKTKPWPVGKGFDDLEGERSIKAIPNERGIVRFQAGFDELKPISAVQPPLTDVGLDQSYELAKPIINGGSIRVFVRATDVMGNSAGDWVVVRVDSTPPRFVTYKFEKNIDCTGSKVSVLPVCSRILLHVHDKESGIKTLDYTVTDVLQDKELWSGSNKGQQQTEVDTHRCEEDGTCVCTPFNGCFLRWQTFYFDHCLLVDRADHPIRVKVAIYNNAGLSTETELKLGILEGLDGIDKCEPPTTGGPTVVVIVGIIIAIVLLLLLILLVVLFFLTRRRQDRPYMPDSFADFRVTVAQSKLYWSKRANQSNPVYFNANVVDIAEEDDVYLYGSMVTEDVADWKIAASNVTLGDKLPNAKGRFADIHSATLRSKGGRQEVVAKTLKHGGNAETKLLMAAKMNFWATDCPKHENILLFLGAVHSVPILLFKLCDLGTLGSWLSRQGTVTEDLADKMITFSVQIARGLQQLHVHQVIHRRLGVRNILLKTDDVGRVVAKVAGFGPIRSEVQRRDTDKEMIPVKWMSPEQLNLNPGERRTYNAKTDVWSYGVTVWEIFSKGGPPYPELRSRELRTQLARGHRMTRPANCPDVMFEQVIDPCWRDNATSRPTVAALITNIETLFLRGAPGDGYYYETRMPQPGRHNDAFQQDV